MAHERSAGLDADAFFTLAKPCRFELSVKGSRFIGHAASANGKEIAEKLTASIAGQYRDATHCCYAYRIGLGDRSLFRTHDAGEPSGTAGKPILQAIDRRRLCDVVCIVVRYFGGRKLGTGGLARAYGECAGKTLDQGERVEQYLMQTIRLRYGYEWTGRVMSVIRQYAGKIETGDFQAVTEMGVRVRKSKAMAFRGALADATSGKITVLADGPSDASNGSRNGQGNVHPKKG